MSDSEGEIEYDTADEVEVAPDGEVDDDLIAEEEDYDSDEATPAPDADAEEEDPEAAEEGDAVEEEVEEAEPKPRAKRAIVPTRAAAEPGMFLVSDRPGFGRAEAENVEEIIVVPDEDRRCSHALSTFELTELISVRTAQISASGPTGAMVDIPPELTNARDIAIYELKMRRCPLKIQRLVGQDVIPASNGKPAKVRKFVEFWSPNEA
jgi:hypothetical protein